MMSMTDFGKWIQRLPPLKAALGTLLLVAVASVSIGAAGMGIFRDVTEMPERLDRLEESTDTLAVMLDKHIVQDSTQTHRIFCVVAALAEQDGEPINPLDPCRRN